MIDSTSQPADSTVDLERAVQREGVTFSLFGLRRDSFSERYHLTRRGKAKRLREIVRIAKQFDIFHGLTPVKMRLMFEALGPTFVKVGQILSMRSEMLPQSFCDELSKLRADADPMPYQTVVDTLAKEYGRPIEEIFSRIDPKPLGSASLAQVHRATLITGEDVAVKVQRPGVRETMAQDVSIMRSLAKVAAKLFPDTQIIDFKGVVEELWDTFEAETDSLIEARNLAAFKKFSQPYKYMDCPAPYPELCTEHVVVMDYVDGISVSHPGQLVAAGYDLKEIGTKLVDNYATQILDEGFFHADPHPGNIIVRGGQIVLIDLGMTGRLDQRTRNVLKDMIFAVAKQDSPALADSLLRFAVASPDSEDYPSLLADLDMVVQEFGTVDLSELDIAAFLTSLTQLASRHGIEIPSSITTVGRALVTLEGLLDEFIPNVNMIQIISAHIAASQTPETMVKNEAKSLAIDGRQALHAGEAASGQDHGKAIRIIPAKAFINSLDDFERIDIPIELPGDALIADPTAGEVIVFRLRGILPPGVYAGRQKILTEVLPIKRRSLWLEEIDPIGAVDIVSSVSDPAAEIRILVHL